MAGLIAYNLRVWPSLATKTIDLADYDFDLENVANALAQQFEAEFQRVREVALNPPKKK